MSEGKKLQILNSILTGLYANPDPQTAQEMRTEPEKMHLYAIKRAEDVLNQLTKKQGEEKELL